MICGLKICHLDSIKFRVITSVAVRIINAFATFTFFQPDEYFQSWEVAYQDVYGVGFRSWEWHAGIRTSLIPRFFSYIILLGEYLGINYLILGKLVMAAVAACGDVYASLLAQRLGKNAAIGKIAWALSLFSMFNWYCSTRAFSNTFEMVLATVGFYHWYGNNISELILAQCLAHISIALRPSIAIFWLVLGVDLLRVSHSWLKRLVIVLLSVIIAAFDQGIIMFLDQSYYGNNNIPYYEFLKYNFGENISEIYGTHPWHWYLSQGVPFILLGYLPFVFYGLRKASWKVKTILILNILAFSAIPHKEFRFLYYLLPLFHYVAALGFVETSVPLRIVAITVNIISGLYFSIYHQRGVIDVVNTIKGSPEITKVSFLMPCHSTPWHAYFQRHNDITFIPQFLTCEPPWNISSAGYVDEADQFYSGPIRYMKTHPEKLDETIVIYEPLEALMGEMGYETLYTFYNGLFSEDTRRRGKVILMRKKS